MAEINRFEIGGIFYDCKDGDARNEIASLQRKSRLDYSQTAQGGLLEVPTAAPVTVYAATGHVRVYVYVQYPYDESVVAARTMRIFINGQLVMRAGGTAQYVGPWTMGEFDLWEGDVLSIGKEQDGYGTNTVSWTVTPYYT